MFKAKYYNILKGNKCFRVNALLFTQTSVCTKTEYYMATNYRLLPTGGGINKSRRVYFLFILLAF